MRVNIRKGLIYKYTRQKFQQYMKDDPVLDAVSPTQKRHLYEEIAGKACVFLVLLTIPYFFVLIFAFYVLSVQGNFLVVRFYKMVDEGYEMMMRGGWGAFTQGRRATVLLLFMKFLPFIAVLFIALIPLFLLDAVFINRLLKSEIEKIHHLRKKEE